MSHNEAQGCMDRLLSSLHVIQNANAASSDGITNLTNQARQDKDVIRSLRFEMEQLQNEKRDIEEQLLAFESENMRLTNELDELRYLSTGAEASTAGLSEAGAVHTHVAQLMAEKRTLQSQNEALEERCQRYANELDEMRYLKQENLALKQGSAPKMPGS